MSDISDLSDTIVAKSDQLNAVDLIPCDKVIKVSRVVRYSEKGENKFYLNYEGDDGRPFKPCLTVRRIIMELWSKDGSQYIGRKLRLYRDPTATYGGEEVGGIRVNAMSHIAKKIEINLPISKHKRQKFIIEPLANEEKQPYPADKFNKALDAMRDSITSGKFTPEQVITRCEATGALTDEQRQTIRDMAKTPDIDNLMDDGD